MSDIDFVELRKHYERIPKGLQADLRRVTKLDDIPEIAVSYRLFPGRRIDKGLQRVLFCLPWVKHGTGPIGASLAAAHINEKRLFQVIRSESPNDLIQLRRLLQWAEPTADWADFGPQILYWNDHNKRRLLESYYIGNPESVQS
jgi:CRISPR system Cascade subunit CasB